MIVYFTKIVAFMFEIVNFSNRQLTLTTHTYAVAHLFVCSFDGVIASTITSNR